MTQPNKKSRPTNHKSKLLGEEENTRLFQLIGTRCVSLSTAVVQLLVAEPPTFHRWMKKLSGVATFVKDNHKRSYYIRIYDLRSSGCIWEQEIYNQFKYNSSRNYFHTFDTDDCAVGLNFANEEEARTFCDAIQEKLNHRRDRRHERKQRTTTPNNRQSTPAGGGARKSIQSSPMPSSGSVSSLSSVSDMSTSSKKKDKDKKKKKLTKTDIGAPSDFRHVGHVGWDPNTGAFDMDNLDPDLKRVFDDAGISEQQLQDEDTAQFIYDFIETRGGIDAVKQAQRPPARPPAIVPPMPQPPVPQPFIPSSAPPPPPSRQPPPPTRSPALPPQRSTAFAPPPPPNRAPMKTAMAAPPPPPPSRVPRQPPPSMAPPTNHSMPPAMAPPPPPRAPAAPVPRPPANVPPPPTSFPPPPPPSMAPPRAVATPPAPPPPAPGFQGGDDVHSPRSDMLSQIRGGAALKHVDPSEQEPVAPDSRGQLLDQIRGGFSLKQVDATERPPSVAVEDGLAGALARALANRAKHIHEDDDDEDEDVDDDDWSD